MSEKVVWTYECLCGFKAMTADYMQTHVRKKHGGANWYDWLVEA